METDHKSEVITFRVTPMMLTRVQELQERLNVARQTVILNLLERAIDDPQIVSAVIRSREKEFREQMEALVAHVHRV